LNAAFEYRRRRVSIHKRKEKEKENGVPMKTRLGLKSRPDFRIVDWRAFGGPSQQAALAGPSGNGGLPGSAVAEPTVAEIVDDGIPWNDPIPNHI
jgi:hypothetical protein